MQIDNEFTLELPPDETYKLLLDLDRVTPCMPGASLGAELPDGSRAVKVTVKLGPMRFSYDGTVRIAEQDSAARRAVLKGAANETRGQGSAEAAITMLVEEATGGSRVSTSADIALTGRAAQMGHGVVESVTKQLIGQMTQALSERFVDAAAAAEAATEPSPDQRSRSEASPRQAVASTSAPPVQDAPEPRPLKATALLWAVVRGRLASLFRRRAGGAA